MTEHNTQTTTLNTLIATLLDSVDGYTKAAQDVRDQDLAQRFSARARERQSAITGLQAAVAAQGGNPEDDGTLLASIHRGFINLKEAVTGTDDKAILNEVERGEDYLKAKFEAALKMDDLTPQSREAISTAWNSVKAGHDEMSALKHRREGADDYAREQEFASENERVRRDDEPLV